MAIKDLAAHPAAYVSVSELAEYWKLDRHQIYKFIDLGGLRAIRLGPRTFRVHVEDAREFERDAKLGPVKKED
jgi:excisionase family DNA binding protein